jgi:HEAT repeat protein
MLLGFRGLWIIASLLLLPEHQAFAIKVPQGMANCPSLQACMTLLNTAVPATDDGEGSNAEILARDLGRFGDAAKQELLNRAVGPQPDWRNVAGAILGEWPSWSPSDVPKLRDALRKDPGGWVARPLGRIATPEAVHALVEDLPNGSESQTGFVLSHLGAKAIPYLFPLLEGAQGSEPAARAISDMGDLAMPFASSWVALASDTQKPLNVRLAALRGIAALGPRAMPVCAGLHPLLTDPDPVLQSQARVTFKAVRDPIVVMQLAQACRPVAPQFDPLAFESFMCLREIASYGEGARDASRLLLPFLKSQNATERVDAITVLGMSGYQPAVSQIESELGSQDWRIVYAAIRSLGWLGEGGAAAKIEEVASGFWLPEVREIGIKTVSALRFPKGRADRPTAESMQSGEGPFEIDERILEKAAACPSQRWKWQDVVFEMPAKVRQSDNSLNLWGGTLSGTDRGEFIGQLTWRTDTAKPEIILTDNVTAISRTEDGNAIALFGLAHMGFNYGYVLRLDRDSEGRLHLAELARLPAEGDGLASLGPDLFAVRTAGRIVVFSANRGILGLAKCE